MDRELNSEGDEGVGDISRFMIQLERVELLKLPQTLVRHPNLYIKTLIEEID
jgi:hypothetical protein